MTDINRLRDVQGSFQSKENGQIYILNNKAVYFIQKFEFTIISIIVKLKVNEEAVCVSYLPCYSSENKLEYTIAICEDKSLWWAVPMNYSSSSRPAKLDPIKLDRVNHFVQAQCIDNNLLVLHNPTETPG